MDLAAVLRAAPAFTRLNDQQIDSITALTMVREYREDETIFRQGEDAFGVCVVLEGSVSILAQMAGRLMEIETVGPGGLLAWSGLVEPFTFTSTAVCLTRCTIAIIKVLDLERLLEEDQGMTAVLGWNLAAVISRRFHETQERLARNMVGS